jgi:hypothetical protein
VRELAIQFHRPGKEDFLPVFRQILAALAPGTTVRVVVGDTDDRAIFESARRRWFPEGNGPAITYAVADKPITSWLRDRLAVCARSGGDAAIDLLAPADAHTGPEARVHDWTVPWTLRGALGESASIRRADFRFDGGDLIADGERCYVATPLFGRNPDAAPATLLAKIEAAIGRPVLRLGTTGDVPDHHIGMFVTPLGGGRVAVGDPDLALRHVAANAIDDADVAEERLERFRRVARELEAAGCTVIRIPLLPKRADFVFLSYNNVLCDRRADGLHVLMPAYGIPALDAAATQAWKAAGAVAVHPIDVRALYELGGSVRCLVAPLVRE